MKKNSRKKFNRIVISIAALLILLCLIFIGMFLHAANEQSFLVVFILAFLVAIVIIFFTAKDMLR